MDYVLIGVILILLAAVFVLFYKNKQLESESQQVEFEKSKRLKRMKVKLQPRLQNIKSNKIR